mmetsp:Transcript_45035/g.134407  ORF Transcript_45035/g.134407 Transcript_45035/m.134407 type:complete len:202 (-) Transcript_45035:553-1158(-)
MALNPRVQAAAASVSAHVASQPMWRPCRFCVCRFCVSAHLASLPMWHFCPCVRLCPCGVCVCRHCLFMSMLSAALIRRPSRHADPLLCCAVHRRFAPTTAQRCYGLDPSWLLPSRPLPACCGSLPTCYAMPPLAAVLLPPLGMLSRREEAGGRRGAESSRVSVFMHGPSDHHSWWWCMRCKLGCAGPRPGQCICSDDSTWA